MSDDDDVRPRSRSDLARERKGEEERLATLAKALVDMSPKLLRKLDLEEALLDAVEDARRISAHSALARQLRVVRRELRNGDNEAIGAAVDELLNPSGRASPQTVEALAWMERMLGEGNTGLQAFLDAHERADRQRLGALVRNVRKADEKKAPRARKALQAAITALLAAPKRDDDGQGRDS